MKSFLLILNIIIFCIFASDDVDHYYRRIDPSLPSAKFKDQLYKLISNHKKITYKKVWGAFDLTDTFKESHDTTHECEPQQIVGPYSNHCWNYRTDQCGRKNKNGKTEGNCYNREHSWPKSWWGGSMKKASATDIHHLYPTDAYVNRKRGNYPLGIVDRSRVIEKFGNGCMIGHNASPSYTGIVYEPIDSFKGDLARTYFYMSTAYRFKCCDMAGVHGSRIKPWLEEILRKWHIEDPVDDEEKHRNDVIYEEIQHNRNPFIDHPEWVDLIEDF